MAVLSLPLTFNNSFWTQDYRGGLEVLFRKLEQSVVENDEIVTFIMARAIAEHQLASALMNPALTAPPGTGFTADEGASLLMAFRGLQLESVVQGQVHKSVAHELQTLVAEPFNEWAQDYKKRLRERKKAFLDIYLPSYEQALGEVSKLKHQYLSKIRLADEAEDDAKFAPTRKFSDKFTSSPLIRPHDRTPPQRTASVSDRIAQRFKDIQNKTFGNGAFGKGGESEKDEAVTTEKAVPKVDKGKGKAFENDTSPPLNASPAPLSPPLPPAKLQVDLPTSPTPPMPPSPILLAGLSLPPSAVSQLLIRASGELPLRPVQFPLLGEYQDCFTGEEFVTWLKENVHGLGGSLDRAEDAARDLTERDNLLRRIGEFGNQFELSDDAFYQFRPKAFNLEGQSENSLNSPIKTLAPTDTLLKRTGTIVKLVTKALNAPGEPTHIKARQDAGAADQAYRVAVRNLDRQRLALEDRVEDTLKTLQRWEIDRLRAVKTVLLQYQGTLANLPKALEAPLERSATLIASYQPESDLTALIERYRTGPFKPEAHIYESVVSDDFDVAFGLDLRKWADGGWALITPEEGKKDLVPPVLTSLLAGLEVAYQNCLNDTEKRKAWIYEVPLPVVHHLREALNSLPSGQPIPMELLDKYDAPVLASALKLWLLELSPPLALWEGWEEFRKLYPTVGSAKSGSEEQRIQELKVALHRLPLVHLYVMDKILHHLKIFIESTTVEEPNEVYITKLALSVGRTLIRPRFESELSIQDRHPTLLFIDLLKHYEVILPSTISSKKRESERKIPLRKRTAPVDMRLSRSRISNDADPRQLLAAQHVAQNPTLAKKVIPSEMQVAPHVPVTKAEGHIPPPPPIPDAVSSASTDVPPRPTFKEPPVEDDDPPPRPLFKDPVPEVDDSPPRPTFKEPPPDNDDSPPRPSFVDPPPEVEGTSPPRTTPVTSETGKRHSLPPGARVSVTPPTPHAHVKRQSSASPRSGSPSSAKDSRSSSPNQDSPGTHPSTLSRSNVGSRPKMARGPRAPPGSNVNSLMATLNKNTVGSPTSPTSPPVLHKRLSSPPRPSSVYHGKVDKK